VRVSDGVLTATEDYQLTVRAVNDPPVIDPETIVVPPLDEDKPMTIHFNATDVDGTMPMMAIFSDNPELLPTPAGFVGLTTSKVTITPVADMSGTARVTLTASDGTAVDTRQFVVTVRAVNDPPTISGNYPNLTVADKEVGDGTFQVTIDVTGGTVTLGTIAGLTFVDGDDEGSAPDGDGNQDAHMIFQGNRAAVNAALTGLIDTVTNGTITVTVSDLGVSPSDSEGITTRCFAQGSGSCAD
jgi:hypothetical protein